MTVQSLVSQSIIERFEDYLTEEEIACNSEESQVAHLRFLAPYGFVKTLFRAHGDKVTLYAQLTECLPPYLGKVPEGLYNISGGRLWFNNKELGWAHTFELSEFDVPDAFDEMFDWIAREVWIAGTLITLVDETNGDYEPDFTRIMGFGPPSALDNQN